MVVECFQNLTTYLHSYAQTRHRQTCINIIKIMEANLKEINEDPAPMVDACLVFTSPGFSLQHCINQYRSAHTILAHRLTQRRIGLKQKEKSQSTS